MKFAWLGCLLWGSLLVAGQQDEPEANVNARYTIESVEFSGGSESTISAGLQKDLSGLPGGKLNPSYLEELARRIRKELHVRAVTPHVLRGDTAERVKVVFEIKGRPRNLEVSVPKFLYHAKQGWSAAAEGTLAMGENRVTAGVVSDNDALAERYTGVMGRYENRKVGTRRVRFRFQAATYHEQWNRATRLADTPAMADRTSPIYRTRQSFEPTVTVVLAAPLTLSVGASFGRMETEFPAASPEAANAVISTLRYHRRMEDDGPNQHDLDAGYSLRAATRILNSDFVYARHTGEVRYTLTRGRSVIVDEAMAGAITGQAPLFERYVLGNSSTLRGWNKFDIDPLGGDRMVHNSLDYRYRMFDVFYDTGAVWNRGQGGDLRHSVGVGLRQSGFSLAVAFPVREKGIEPVFILGMNY